MYIDSCFFTSLFVEDSWRHLKLMPPRGPYAPLWFLRGSPMETMDPLGVSYKWGILIGSVESIGSVEGIGFFLEINVPPRRSWWGE